MYKLHKKHNLKKLYQILGIVLLCVVAIYASYGITLAWFMDESITSNGKPTILLIGTVDLNVETSFDFYNLVLAPDTYYTTYLDGEQEKRYGTYLTTTENNDVGTIYVRAKFETDRDELSLYFDDNITTNSSYSESDKNKWCLHNGWYYYIGSVGTSEVEFNRGYYVDNTLHNGVAEQSVYIEFTFESIQRPYDAYKAVWENEAPAIFKEFAEQDHLTN